MFFNKARLIALIEESQGEIKIVIAKGSPSDRDTGIEEAVLNDYVLHADGTLELWHNIGFEI